MEQTHLDPRIVRAPDFAPGEWLNAPAPLAKDSLRGKVVLVDFWDYTCVNCIRTLPYLTSWHARYADLGLVVIGIHAPEFSFARSRRQIEAAIEEFGIRYPILLDNDYQTWLAFANRAWPTKYLIDADGYIRYRRQGEGGYQETELAIQSALLLRNPKLSLPDPIPLLRPEDSPGAVCYRPTPELYAGYGRGAQADPRGEAGCSPLVYDLPEPDKRQEGQFYMGGIWRAERECVVFAGQDGGQIVVPYQAARVNVVLSPSSDPVEIMLDLPPGSDRHAQARDVIPTIDVRQDGMFLTPGNAGVDIEYDDGGVSYVSVERPRMVEVVSNPGFERHELELTFRANGLAVYAFTFTTTCVPPGKGGSGAER